MRLSLEPVTGAWHRPLTYYYIVSCFQAGAKLFLNYFLNFKRYQHGRHHYWYRPALSSVDDEVNNTYGNNVPYTHNEYKKFGPQSRKKLPIVFIHCIGPGLVYYLHFFNKIVVRDVFLIELTFISTRFTEAPSPPDQIPFVQVLGNELLTLAPS